MSTSIAPYEVKPLKSHLEIVLFPPLEEGTWKEIESLGDEVLSEIQQRKNPVCVVDLSNMSYMGSSMVALLVRIWKEVKSRNGRLAVIAAHPVIRETISLAGLDKIWDIYGRLSTGCQALGVTPSDEHSGSRWAGRKKVLIGVAVVLVVIAGISILMLKQQP